jgi:LuxR family maltose regulon positive regulatory protein
MDRSLLATKLRIPPQAQRAVRRPRLVDTLERDIPHYKLVQIAAPAGYGKTTLLAQWARASRLAVAWLSLGAEDNDRDRFLRYMFAAWGQAQAGVQQSPLGLLLEGISTDCQAVVTAFINAAHDAPGHVVFVLDDYHLIEDASIHQVLAFLLEHLPQTLHFVLAGRAEPPLPLARYRARHELLELRAEDLQFLPHETSDFLNRQMGLSLAPDAVAALQVQLEGWIAGLQLLALSLQRRRDAADGLAISGRHRFIADFLNEDVLAHLPAPLHAFLLQTSILDRLCGSLCDAVTEGDGGQETLETLERENLFLVSLDDNREWFRYHRIFANFLQGELYRQHPAQVARLHRRAARWHLAHDLPEPAFSHAVDGHDVELVIQIAELYFAPKLFGGEIKVVERWLESLPAAWYSSHPMLNLARATFLIITGAFDASVRCLDGVEQRLALAESDDKPRQLAKVAMLRCAIACFQNDLVRAELFADRALRDLREEDHSFRADIYHALGDTYRQNGRWEAAHACYLKVFDFSYGPAARLRSAHVFGALADLELRQGHLRDAVGYWEKALAAVQDRENWGRLPLPVIGWVYLRMGETLYEWNELEQARDYLRQGLERAELGGDARALIAGYLLAARLKLTAGDSAAARDFLERARPLMENAPFPDWADRFGRVQLELWLAQSQLRAAVDWADAMLRGDALDGRSESEESHLAIARVLLLKGDKAALERALALLGHLLKAAEAEGRSGIQIEALALQALARWQRGEQADALIALERALRLAEPEGYVRLFADLGLPMARLLQQARSRAVLLEYVEALLAAFGGDPAIAPPEAALPEPLTSREQEILELVAAGLTNREIAERLVIASETVKKHTVSIYGKLSVRSRTAAVAKARQLNLLT